MIRDDWNYRGAVHGADTRSRQKTIKKHRKLRAEHNKLVLSASEYSADEWVLASGERGQVTKVDGHQVHVRVGTRKPVAHHPRVLKKIPKEEYNDG